MDEECFAVHGGTAINLFVNDLLRLSVDILSYATLRRKIFATYSLSLWQHILEEKRLSYATLRLFFEALCFFLLSVNLGNLQREQKKHNSFHVIGRGLSCFIYVSQGFPRAHNSMERHTVPRFVHLKTGSGRNWRTENLIKMLKTKYLLLCASLLFTSTVFTACDDDDDSSSSTEKLLKSTTETDYEVNDGEIGASNTFIVESYVYDSKGRVIGFTVNDSDYNYKCVISYNGNHVKMIKTEIN
jgi:hypothetical protein